MMPRHEADHPAYQLAIGAIVALWLFALFFVEGY
jgi:hypothetical protein